jgi:hypothetical protein
MTDFGLLVARYNVAAPALSTDGVIRELRIDAGGRVDARLADGNDNTLSYFAAGDAVGSGIGTASAVAGDRGVLIFGKNSTDSNYQPIRVLSDGSVVISDSSGTDASAAADKANITGGEIALAQGSYVLVQTIPFTTGHFHVFGWTYASDKNTQFQLAVAVHSGVGSPVRADIKEILDTQISSSARPSSSVAWTRSLDRAGAVNTSLCVFAKQLQQGANGSASSMINVDTTT